MTIIAVLITVLLEQQKSYIGKIRGYLASCFLAYVRFFLNREFKTQREIRMSYLTLIAPLVLLLILLKILLFKHVLAGFLVNLVIFVLFVEVLVWKEEAKELTPTNKSFAFINTFATRFFAPLFWFWVFPFGIGVVAYYVIMLMSQELKNKGLDLVVYNVVVDKMMFYANIIPYTILYIFIAFAGDFEHVSHYLIEQRKNFTKSFYFLNNLLNDVILIAIDRERYEESSNNSDGDGEAGIVKQDSFSLAMVKYVVAVLYRAGLFFLAVVVLFSLARIIGLIG
jgi:hypothetical protein